MDLPVNVSINNAARRYLYSANPDNDGQFRGFNVIGARGDVVIIQMITVSDEVKVFSFIFVLFGRSVYMTPKQVSPRSLKA